MLMQNFGVTNKEHYGMLRYFLEWSISHPSPFPPPPPRGGLSDETSKIHTRFQTWPLGTNYVIICT